MARQRKATQYGRRMTGEYAVHRVHTKDGRAFDVSPDGLREIKPVTFRCKHCAFNDQDMLKAQQHLLDFPDHQVKADDR